MVTATQRPTHSDERGIALAMALLGIVLIGALVTGTLYAGRLEMSSSRNAIYSAQANEAAEAGLTAAFNPWNTAWNSTTNYPISTPAQPGVQQATVYPFTSPQGNTSIRYTNTVRRLQGGIYEITSLGEKLDAGGNVVASRLLSELGKLVVPSVDIQAAVTANADVQVNGNTTKVDGNDQVPAGWGGQCPVPAAGTGVYGIRTSDQVGTSGNPDIDGVPSDTKENDVTVTTATVLTPFNSLVPLASITLSGAGGIQTYNPAPSASGSPAGCNLSDLDNWGEPYRVPSYIPQCITYMPIVYYPGNGTLKLSNGRAQGIILSAGDIDVAGNFEFDGILIALGAIDTHGTGNKMTGAVLSGNANINDDDTIAGTPTILYSSCAVSTVLQGSAAGLPLTQRRFAQVNPR
jgi:hypothetical protein